MKGIQTILIIASDRPTSELTKKLIRKGYNARHAITPDEGLILLTEEKPDLVILSLTRHDEGGLKCLQEISLVYPRTLVIVAADHEDSRLAIECMRRGAQDYLIRPLSVGKLMNCMERIQNRQRCLFARDMPDTDSVMNEQKTIRFGNDLEKIPFIINQAVMNAQTVCPDMEMLKMALGEILLNAVEHGNLNITMEEKAAAVKNGTFENLIKQRKSHPSYASRFVTLQILMDRDILQFVVIDQGDGFEYQKEYDPNPHAHIGSGLGVQIARNFFNEVIYEGCGNKVRLIYQREPSSGGRTDSISMMHGDLMVQLTKSFPSGLLLVSDLDRIIMWNTKAEDITSIKSPEIVGKTTSEAPTFIRDLLSEENSRIYLKKGALDPSTIEKSLHTLKLKEGGSYSVVLFTDATESLRHKEEMDRLLMESAETRDLMEEQAARLAITLAEMEEKNEIIKDQNQRMIGELEMAARLQKSLLPDTFENLNGVSFTCKYIPSIHIGGDLYDVVDLGGGQTGFIIADVSGHGVAAALISSMFKMSFHALAATVASPTILMHMLNREMKPVLDEDYITAFFVLTDRFGKSITYTNAGHPTPLLFKRSTGKIIGLDTDGFFLGSFDDGGYGEKVETGIDVGDALLMYTDCILETENSNGEQYGKERLVECFRNAVRELRGNAVIESIEADVRSFNCKEAFDDDFTVMLLEFWEDADVHKTRPKKDGSDGFVEF